MALSDNLRRRSPGALRDEREQLGFVRRPAVRWLSPGLLARSGVEVLVSGTFGKFADKRELQNEAQDGLDYSGRDELWVDYLSDTGDGFEATYTMAWLLAQERLDFHDQPLPRGEVLLLGGDEVYPTADPEAYEDRFIGPFAAARPRTDAAVKPHLYALPGNHDWYDGLTSFLRIFCARDGRIGEWDTRQRRGYFALKMPNDWWVWAIDIQLDTYIDDLQLDYFRGQPVAPGDKIILMTAKPAWVKAVPGRVEPASWRYLSYFEERVVGASGGRLVMTITGDLHHYARYEPRDDEAPTRLTAGGGGAYLSGTHTLYPELQLRSLDSEPAQTVTYEREQIYPRAKDSRRLAKGIVGLARLNPSFAGMLGVIYALIGVAMLGTLKGDEAGLAAAATSGGFGGMLTGATGTASVIGALLLLGAIFGGTDIVPGASERSHAVVRALKGLRLLVATAHTAVHLLIATVVLWTVAEVLGDHPALIWIITLIALFAAGAALGATIFGVVLLAVHRTRGVKAWEATNSVFLGQSIPDYKHLVRMHFAADGSLTLYPLGVDRTGRAWDHTPERAPAPTFSPRDGAPAVHPIDVPLRYDAAGRRAH